MSINVNRDVQDTFYRYKMPPIIAKVEGKGNGIKTVIVNMSDVAKALGCPPTYPCKFFGCELGAQTQFDVKNDRFIVNGSHDASKLQDMLDIFVKKFILCKECDNPETTMVVKHGSIGLVCKACGGQSLVDLRHKLCTYIQKNPANQADSKSGKKKKDKRNKDKDHSSGDDANHTANGSGQKHPKTNGVAKAEKKAVKPYDEDDGDWSVDVSEEAVKARMLEITSGAKTLTMNDDLEKTPSERANLLYTLIKTRLVEGSILKADKEIAQEAERLDIQNKAPLLLVEVLCDHNMREQVKTYKKHFLRVCHGNVKAQKSLLGGFEKLIEIHKDALLPKTMHVLKELYDNDIIEEEVMIEWGKKPSKKYVSKELSQLIHEKSQPFIQWLEEAEEETSDEEDEVAIVYTSKTEEQLKKEEASAVDGSEEEAGEDDLDIDDI